MISIISIPLIAIRRLLFIIIGFVAENFTKDKIILLKTRRVYSYSKLYKASYIFLLVLSMLNSNFSLLKYAAIYNNFLLRELYSNIWKFYLNTIPKNLGLITSNHHKSIMYKFLNKSHLNNESKVAKISTNYLHTFDIYQFFVKQSLLKKFLIYYMSILPIQWLPYNINFDIYSGYVWLNWSIKLNTAHNVFYLKAYNY